MELLCREVPATSLVVAVDPGKASNRVWLTSGERGLIGEPVTLPVLREGVEELERLIAASGVAGPPVIGLEATGSLHRAWAAEIERRWPGSLRLFAAVRDDSGAGQLGTRRFKTDDRDCAALVWCCVRARAGQRSLRSWSRCWGPFVIVASSSLRAVFCSSVCMTSSTRCARACRPRRVTGGR